MIRKLTAAALLAGATLLPAVAQEAKLPAASLSSHYEEVSKHLELGGVFYGYMDIDEDVATFTKLLDEILVSAKKTEKMPLPENLTASGIVKELGLDSVKAVGASSRKNGTQFHNRAYFATPGGQAGLFKMFGGKAAPFVSPTLAPSGSDLVAEEDLNLGVVLDIVKNIAKQIGDPSVLDQLEQSLAQPMGPMPFSVGEFIKKLDTKITLIASLDPVKKLNLKDSPEPIPFVNGVLAMDNMGWLFAELAKMSQEGDEVQLQTGDGFEALRFAKPLPPEAEGYKPLLYHDKKTGRIFLATSPEFLTTCIEGKTPISGDPVFAKAMEGLPKEGNGLSYVSPNAIKQIWHFLELATESSMGEKSKSEMDMMRKIWEVMLPKGDNPISAGRANLQGGMLYVSNGPDTHKSTLATIAVYPAALMAIGASTGMKSIQQAREMQLGGAEEDKEPEAAPAPKKGSKGKDSANPSDKIKSNLQQIAFAGEAYFLDHPKDKTVTYSALVKNEFLFDIPPVDSEDYKSITLKRVGGKIVVKPASGPAINFEYPAVTD